MCHDPKVVATWRRRRLAQAGVGEAVLKASGVRHGRASLRGLLDSRLDLARKEGGKV